MYWPSEPNSLSSTFGIIYLIMVSVSYSEITRHSSSHVDSNTPLSGDKESCKLLEESIFQCRSYGFDVITTTGNFPLISPQFYHVSFTLSETSYGGVGDN